MVNPRRLCETLGGARVFRERQATYTAVIERVRAGLPYAALEAVATRFDIPQDVLVRVLRIPHRTLARRKKEKRLRSDESDRLLRLARIAARAEDVLGTAEKAGRWLQKPNRDLGGLIPVEELDTDIGTRHVDEILGRIEHGLFS